jgi:hypothetical protein
MGAPPLYEPGTVADVILYAAEHPSRDLVAGGAARMRILLQKLSPKLMDAMALLVGFKMQKTDDPEPADAPNNLFAPVPGDERTEGDVTARSHPTSLYNWLETHPGARCGAVAGGAVAVGALLAPRWPALRIASTSVPNSFLSAARDGMAGSKISHTFRIRSVVHVLRYSLSLRKTRYAPERKGSTREEAKAPRV